MAQLLQVRTWLRLPWRWNYSLPSINHLVYGIRFACRETWDFDGRDLGICGCAISSFCFLPFILKWSFLHMEFPSQSTGSVQGTAQRLYPPQDCALPIQEFDSDYWVPTVPFTFVCIMITVGTIPKSHGQSKANMAFAYLLKQAKHIRLFNLWSQTKGIFQFGSMLTISDNESWTESDVT